MSHANTEEMVIANKATDEDSLPLRSPTYRKLIWLLKEKYQGSVNDHLL